MAEHHTSGRWLPWPVVLTTPCSPCSSRAGLGHLRVNAHGDPTRRGCRQWGAAWPALRADPLAGICPLWAASWLIDVYKQSPNSPEMNALDLGVWAMLASEVNTKYAQFTKYRGYGDLLDAL